jgi:hypothetical protein
MSEALEVVLAGVHRGGSRITEALPDQMLAAINWTLVDPKPGRSDAGAVRLRHRTATARISARTADAVAVVREGAGTARVLVAAVDTADALRQLVEASTGMPILWQLVGRMPLSSGGTCFGIAGSIAAADRQGQLATLDLLDALKAMALPASSVYLTDSSVLAGPLLQTFRAVVSAHTADHLTELAAGSHAVTDLLLVLPNDKLPAQMLTWRAGESVAATTQRALGVLGWPRAGSYAAIVVAPNRIDVLRIDARTQTLIGLITLEPPAARRDAALFTD